jgi:hypothetical protein
VIAAVVLTRKPASDSPVPVASGSGPSMAAGSGAPHVAAMPDAQLVAQEPEPAIDAAPRTGIADDPVEAAKRVGFLGNTSKPPPDAGTAKPKREEPDEEEDAEAQSPQDICRRGCMNAFRCGNAATTNCNQECLARPAVQVCFAKPFTTCSALAVCGVRATCGNAALQGTGTCAAAAACQGRCRGSVSCGCECLAGMSPSHANALSKLDACAVDCGLQADCFVERCKAQIAACQAE